MTAQAQERLIYEGEETSMAFCPPLPLKNKRIKENGENFIHSTGCWRGYVGSWEIKEGHFYLIGLSGNYELIGKEPLFADWFSGVIRIPKGERLGYVHMGFGSVYEKELHIKILNGVVVDYREISNRGKKHSLGEIGWQNLPGFENFFPGDDEI